MTTHQWMRVRNRFFKNINDLQKEYGLSDALTAHILSEITVNKTQISVRNEWMGAPYAPSEPPGSGGYINKHGIRVPNPCHEVDMRGRDLDRFYRNVKQSTHWNDDVLVDAILANPENE